MPALKTLGMVILAAFVVSLSILGYFYARALVNERDARDAAINVDAAVQTAINTGNPQTVSVNVPGNYIVRFVDNCPELGAGDYQLTITLENSKVVVRRT